MEKIGHGLMALVVFIAAVWVAGWWVLIPVIVIGSGFGALVLWCRWQFVSGPPARDFRDSIKRRSSTGADGVEDRT